MKTYTGPTLGGAVATIQCPDWCTTDHAYWDDTADDCFHQSEPIEIQAPRDRDSRRTAPPFPLMGAELRMHSTDPAPAAACMWVQFSEDKADGLELDVAGVDKLLASVDDYRAGLAELREKLAKAEHERRRR
ncbi:hypothetical protein H4W23_22110 [Streptomyces gardneri]|jgi:hypothetical protein|uniref:DUF6907 domain-containing protein n=1 Tax=Streptomyces gardneri TaxID=66892 RepID=UPI0006BC77FF|nr:hypothetical protein [Streptomyces gardneri]QPK47040.1 hypothetical protein H4W23_22110 [Streptomyces gardneri]WRK38457.1 hypothetical protein U0M97_22210 [Streptomyces venezuelae]CUM39553.1 hypothetical protein BN2537_8071 [Streptomyces venezuelae]